MSQSLIKYSCFTCMFPCKAHTDAVSLSLFINTACDTGPCTRRLTGQCSSEAKWVRGILLLVHFIQRLLTSQGGPVSLWAGRITGEAEGLDLGQAVLIGEMCCMVLAQR